MTEAERLVSDIVNVEGDLVQERRLSIAQTYLDTWNSRASHACRWCGLTMVSGRVCNVRRSAENRNHHLPCEAPMPDDKPKTVVPPTRGRGGPHPAEVNEHLSLAHALCGRLIEAAEHRGDQAGADAWLVALRSIEDAEKAMRVAREKQTWRTFQGERVDQRSIVACEHGTRGCPGRGEKHSCQ
jgi:hypothetical protein